MKYKIMKRTDGEWYANLVFPNGKVFATTEGYKQLRSVVHSCRRCHSGWPIYLQDGHKFRLVKWDEFFTKPKKQDNDLPPIMPWRVGDVRLP